MQTKYYLQEVKRQLRDKYNFVQTGGTEDDPTFDDMPDGVYPMEINSRIDKVKIKSKDIIHYNFN